MTKPVLPQPPEFPASNASYNKIVDKMHKSALNAATSAAAIAAVQMCKSAVTGVNTYSKKCRRYADDLLVALGGVTHVTDEQAAEVASKAAKIKRADKPAIPLTVDTKDGPVEVDLAKLAVDPSKLPGGLAHTGKTFSNKSNAKRGLKAVNLDHLPLDFLPGPGGTVMPVVTVRDDKGAAFAAERNIAARVAA